MRVVRVKRILAARRFSGALKSNVTRVRQALQSVFQPTEKSESWRRENMKFEMYQCPSNGRGNPDLIWPICYTGELCNS